MIQFIVISLGIYMAFMFGRITAEQEMIQRLDEVMNEFRKAHPELFEDD